MRTKPLLIGSFLISFLLFTNNISIFGQTCATCPGNTVTGIKASAFGDGNTASGNYSFVAGRSSEASKHNAVVIGSYSKATGLHSYVVGSNSFATGNFAYAFGGNSKAEMDFSMAIGHNISANLGGFALGVGKVDALLANNKQESLVIGFNSAYPTLFVSRTPIDQQSGRIGIGNVTDPQAKLHIRADKLEDASLLLEPSDPRQLAKLQLLDGGSGLTAGIKSGLQLFTNLEIMQFAAPQFVFDGPVKVALLEVNGAYNLPTTAGTDDQFLRADGTWAVPDAGVENYWQPSGNNIFFGNAVGIGMEPKERLSIDSPYGRPIHFHIGGSQGINNNAWYNGTNNVRSEDGPAYQISFSNLNMAFKAAENENAGSIVNWNEALVITQQGNVGIGTNDTKTYKLAVKGKMIAEEIVVKYFNEWPDYVFEPTYPLMPLVELQQFVQTHHHLPDMPAAEQMAETGVPVGEMNALLLKKVEELTLYVLQQQKEIEMLKKRLHE